MTMAKRTSNSMFDTIKLANKMRKDMKHAAKSLKTEAEKTCALVKANGYALDALTVFTVTPSNTGKTS